MPRTVFRLSVCALVAATIVWGCTLPWMAGGTETAATMIVKTVSVLQTSLAGSQTAAAGPAQSPAPLPLPLPTASQTPAPVPTAGKPVVSTTALCWTGPGSAYPVVSAIKQGTAVEMLGVGSKTGWFVIANPTYGDRCWIEAKNLQFDPYLSTAGLQVFNPPPTPGPEITPGPSPTP